MDVPRGGNAHFKESVYELHKRESHGFSPSVSHRLDHEVSLQGAGRRVAGADTNCRENMSICSWKSRRILLSATSCGASRDGRRIGCRWSSRTCASATGGGISGLGATSPPRAATSRTMSYFSIFRSTNLPASAGSYSVRILNRPASSLIRTNCGSPSATYAYAKSMLGPRDWHLH